MTYLVICPSIVPARTVACLTSCRIPLDNIMVIDNAITNRGVSASWNMGREHVINRQLDWLIILSAGVVFGKAGGLDFLDHLDAAAPDSWGVEAAWNVGWHLVAFPFWVLDRVGSFDENFFAYYEDLDWSYRCQLAGATFTPETPIWPKVSVDCWLDVVAHGTKEGGAQVPIGKIISYFHQKWGGPSGHESFIHPFNDPANDWTWWPIPPDPRSILP